MKFRHLSNCNQIIEAVCRINIRTLNQVTWIAMENYGDAAVLLVFTSSTPFSVEHFQWKHRKYRSTDFPRHFPGNRSRND